MKNKALLNLFVILAVSLPVLSGCNPGEKATLKVFTIGEGTINLDPEDAVQPVGTAVTLNAVADEGWDFDHWEGNLAGAQNPAQITLFTDVDIIAVFTKKDQVGIADSQFEDMEDIADSLGWTFLVGSSDVSALPVWSITGLVEPDEKSYEGDTNRPIVAKQNLPAQFDWRDEGKLTPVKYQGGCGSCWAFATIGAAEASILIASGQEVDLAEQWLVDCNTSGYGCGGGWWCFNYLVDKSDECNTFGSPLESDYSYTAIDGVCSCSNTLRYMMDSWSYVDSGSSIPSVDKIKQAIIDYGPVVAAVTVNTPFHGYREGVFNASSEDRVNHGVVIVGWDDTLGSNGVWIIKNSWGIVLPQ